MNNMRTAKPIHRRDIILAARERFMEQYKRWPNDKKAGWCDKTMGQIRTGFEKLDLNTCSPSDIDAVLGSPRWAKNECDECDGDFPVTIQIGSTDYEERWQTLCPGCLAEISAFAASIEPKP